MVTNELLDWFDPHAREVPDETLERLQRFAENWVGKIGNEQQLAQPFLDDLCRALGTPRPTDGVLPHEDYQYEKYVRVPDTTRHGRIDLYKKGHFVLEAKCGRNSTTEPGSAPVRGTPGYAAYIESAYNDQARIYAKLLPEGRPPVLIVVDVGHQFWLWRRNRDHEYPGFHSPEALRIPLEKVALEENARILWLAFTDPQALDPSRYQVRVTETAADLLAKMAGPLQERHEPARVARFLIQALFCMFAEDVGLLPPGHFANLVKRSLFEPAVFRPMALDLFQKMRDGGVFDYKVIRRFNGALFDEPVALELTSSELATLSEAARMNWAFVEPSIFGTLIERALDPFKRRKLGAHYTPRAFVDRLVKPVVEEPLRREWELEVRPEAEALWREAEAREAARTELELSSPAARKKDARLESEARVARRDALKALDAFHHRLTRVRVLDPACGTGNFLYVAYDVLKSLEYEVLSLRRTWAPDEAGAQGLVGGAEGIGAVTPAQLLGIELDGFAAEIAQLTLWIGHLQWELRHRAHPDDLPEPIIPPVRTIEHRDALISWTRATPRLDAAGEPVTRWKMGAMKKADTHDGEVPDESVREPVLDYEGVARAPWPEAEFIVGNPPFIGNKMMRIYLGDGYVEALRARYDEVPETVDLVMYWWHRAAERVRAAETARFGFITTNSLRQTFNRRVLETHLRAKKDPLRLVLAVPDHPWTDEGADVRISMTAAERVPEGAAEGVQLIEVLREGRALEEVEVGTRRVSVLHPDLKTGVDVTSAVPLLANAGVSGHGPNPYGAGFRLKEEELRALGLSPSPEDPLVKRYFGARDISRGEIHRYTFDTWGWSLDRLKHERPEVYQWLLDRVYPERRANRRKAYRERWWVYGEPRAKLRPYLEGLNRYLVTPETSKHRFFVWASARDVADHTTVLVCLETNYALGVLESAAHRTWAEATSGRMGVGNDWRYSNSRSFGTFPFPVGTPDQVAAISEHADALCSFRDAARTRNSQLVPTTIYNLVAARRAGEALSAKEARLHTLLGTDALIELHDQLDAAVAAAYGWEWPLDEQEILARLVALNHERAREEAEGTVRWLRPDLAQRGAKGTAAKEVARAATRQAVPWPKDRKAQRRQVFAAIDGATTPPSLGDIARGFKGGGQKRIAALVEELEDLGFILRAHDGTLRRA